MRDALGSKEKKLFVFDSSVYLLNSLGLSEGLCEVGGASESDAGPDGSCDAIAMMLLASCTWLFGGVTI